MTGYYDDTLAAERLRRCYEIAPPRVKQYLEAEIDHVLGYVRPSDIVLELGCGYGRVLGPLSPKAKSLVGIDTSLSTLSFAQSVLRGSSNFDLVQMNAVSLGFRDHLFDVVVCIQNGISAFHVDRHCLIREAVRVARPGGIVLFSSYSDKFWNHRLLWFERQSEEGLIGPLDHCKTRSGTIVSRDGFSGTTIDADEFSSLCRRLRAFFRLVEVDESSLFCEITPH